MSKRYLITIPDAIAGLIDRWAEAEKGKASTLISFLLERVVRESDEKGLIPKSIPDYQLLKHLLLDNYDKLCENQKLKERINELIQGGQPTEAEIVRIAYALELPEDYVEGLKTNGNSTTNPV